MVDKAHLAAVLAMIAAIPDGTPTVRAVLMAEDALIALRMALACGLPVALARELMDQVHDEFQTGEGDSESGPSSTH